MRLRNLKNTEEILNSSPYFKGSPEENNGKWSSVFGNNNPIFVEIGMGKGQFIIEHAKRYPNINFIGLEKFDKVLARSLVKVPEGLDNLLIIRADAINIDQVFTNELSGVFLNFSDPWPKSRHESRRLTSSVFLDKYDKIFVNNSVNIKMKTDNMGLFTYSVCSFSKHGYIIDDLSLDLHNDSRFEDEDIITTEYEDKFSSKGMPIYYVNVKK